MATGLSIFIVGIIFSLIYLYSITRDRWNWHKILCWSAIPLTLITSQILLLIMKMLEISNLYINFLYLITICIVGILLWRLTRVSWDWKRNFRILKILGLATFAVYSLSYIYNVAGDYAKRHKQEVALNREEAARECNAKEIARLEPILDQSIRSVTSDSSLEDVKEALEKISSDTLAGKTKEKVITEISADNIKEKQVRLDIHPKCDTAFYYRILVTNNENGQLSKYITEAHNPPTGYHGGDREREWISADMGSAKGRNLLANEDNSPSHGHFVPDDGAERIKVIARFTVDFEKKRKEEAIAIGRATYQEFLNKREVRIKEENEFKKRLKAETDIKATKAIEEKRAQNVAEKKQVMNQIGLTKNIKCSYPSKYDDPNECSFGYDLSVTVKNNTDKKITMIAFGWDLYAKECLPRGKYTSKQSFSGSYFNTHDSLLMPGESKNYTFTEHPPKDYRNADPNSICIDISDIQYEPIN